MGDKVGIPRSFADEIGVADVTNAIKRHYLPIPLRYIDGTTGVMWGGNGTTGMNFLQRNVTFEKLVACAYITTTVAETTGVILRMFNGATTIFDLNIVAATTVKGVYVSASTAPENANAGASSVLYLNKARQSANWNQLSVVAVFRERLNS